MCDKKTMFCCRTSESEKEEAQSMPMDRGWAWVIVLGECAVREHYKLYYFHINSVLSPCVSW